MMKQAAVIVGVAAAFALPSAAQARPVCHNERVEYRYWSPGDRGFIGHLRECGLPSHDQGINANMVGAALYDHGIRHTFRALGVTWTTTIKYLGGPQARYTARHGSQTVSFEIVA
jgi:hypothetical protein